MRCPVVLSDCSAVDRQRLALSVGPLDRSGQIKQGERHIGKRLERPGREKKLNRIQLVAGRQGGKDKEVCLLLLTKILQRLLSPAHQIRQAFIRTTSSPAGCVLDDEGDRDVARAEDLLVRLLDVGEQSSDLLLDPIYPFGIPVDLKKQRELYRPLPVRKSCPKIHPAVR